MTPIKRIIFFTFIFIIISLGLKAQQPIGNDVIININGTASTDSVLIAATINIYKTMDTIKIKASKVSILEKAMIDNTHPLSITFQGARYKRELNADSSFNRYTNYDSQIVLLTPNSNSDEEKIFYPTLIKLIDTINRSKQETLEVVDIKHTIPFAEKLHLRYKIINRLETKIITLDYPASAARSLLLNLFMFAGGASVFDEAKKK